MSDSERSDVRAFQELESLVRSLGEELATFRRRALQAETKLKDGGVPIRGERSTDLEQENTRLRERLARAEERVSRALERVHFIRQQAQLQPRSDSSARDSKQ